MPMIHCQICNQHKPWGRTQHWASGETVYLCVDCHKQLQAQAEYRLQQAAERIRHAYQQYGPEKMAQDGAGAYPKL